MPAQKQITINSKNRVRDHGEVFTSEREVNDMLNLIKQETQRVDSRFFEPACGTGNFLVEILERKLAVVLKRYKKSQLEYERHSIIALSSLYGVDILEDNVVHCRQRLLDIFTDAHHRYFKKSSKADLIKAATFILERNILWGNALTLKTVDKDETPIIFSEWNFVSKSMVKRRDYTLANLLESQPIEGLNLFSDLGYEAFIPTPIADYPTVHFLKVGTQ
jgi:hypothetical protein